MLSLDGEQQRRHRRPFIGPFRAGQVVANYQASVERRATELVAGLKAQGRAELRTELAGPLATSVITDALGLVDANTADILGWYRHIVAGVLALSDGEDIPTSTLAAVESLRERVIRTISELDPSKPGASGIGALLRTVQSSADLSTEELFSNTAVLMFGAIETSEGMTANALFHLLTHPEQMAEVQARPELLDQAIDESLRLEPAAAVIDRYATVDATLGPDEVQIHAGDLVRVSLSDANRDSAHFESPARFDVHRHNAADHLSFVQGPHACIGSHLARLETKAALSAVFDLLPGIAIDAAETTAPSGLIFRKPDRLTAAWPPG